MILTFISSSITHLPSHMWVQGSNPTPTSMLELSRPVFGLTPHRMDLNPGKSLNCILEGYVDTYVNRYFIL